jgi:O-antigen ligase
VSSDVLRATGGGLVRLMVASAVGIAACALGLLSAELSPRNFVLVVACLIGLAAAALSSRPRCVLLFAWIVTLTYGKAFFFFPNDSDTDFMGVYGILSDVFLIVLLADWMRARPSKVPPHWGGRRAWLWFAPFLAAALLATLTAAKVDWALVEFYRLAKLLVVLIYLQHNLHTEEWWACVAGLGSATSAQALLSILQVALGKTSGGIVGLIGGGGESAEAAAQASAMQGAMGGWFRAYGTIGHPANLATYFLLTIPILLGVSFALKGKWQFWGLVSAVLGMAGLACTQSRGPWMFGAVQIGLVLIGLVLFRVLAANRAVILVGLCAAIALLLAVRFQQFISDRFSRDYNESVELRTRDSHTAFMIFSQHPYLGVGLNNYATKILEFDPEWDWALAGAADFQKQFDSRVFVAPHNFYMFLLAETGFVGLLGFATWMAGIAWVGLMALKNTQGPVKMVCFGTLLGMGGILAQSAVNFSLWVDPILFTTALAAALLATAPSLPARAPVTNNEMEAFAHSNA